MTAKDLAISVNDFSLRKLKVHKDMSDETLCFSAELCFKGVPLAEVTNDGHGGCNRYDWKTSAEHDLPSETEVTRFAKKWVASRPDPIQIEELDQLVAHLIADEEELKWLRRKSKGYICVQLKSHDEGHWKLWPIKSGITHDELVQAITTIKTKLGDDFLRCGHEMLGLV